MKHFLRALKPDPFGRDSSVYNTESSQRVLLTHVLRLGEALHRELERHGITVSAE